MSDAYDALLSAKKELELQAEKARPTIVIVDGKFVLVNFLNDERGDYFHIGEKMYRVTYE